MNELFRTSAFRLALLFFGLFALSVSTVFAAIYGFTIVYADQQVDETIDAEITGLAEQYRQRGIEGLVGLLAERADPEHGTHWLYLLTDQRQRPMAGNLSRWPDAEVGPDGWMRFDLDPGETGEPHQIQATSFLLRGGYQLLVGRDLSERQAYQGRVLRALGWGGGLTLLLGLAGGILTSRRLLARIDQINRASDRVMAGDLSQRIPVRGSGDEIDRLAGNLNRMLERIEQLMAGMRQVTDNIAHDLRSPLSRLRSRMEVALLGAAEEGEVREILQASIAETDQLIATFNALLDIAEAEAGASRAPMTPLDLTALAIDLAELYEPVAEEKDQTLTLAVAGPVPIRGDRHLLSRAVANLIENAIKYTPAGGRIALATAAVEEEARLSVQDSGPGIPMADRERVFDRFVRLEQSRTTAGNGLGLSLVRAVVQLHGGRISLGEAAPGLAVTIHLPLAALPAPIRSPAGAESPQGGHAVG